MKFAEGNDVFYNLRKTKCMCVRPKGMKNFNFAKIFKNDLEILTVGKETYLAAFITDDFSDNEDVIRQMRSTVQV